MNNRTERSDKRNLAGYLALGCCLFLGGLAAVEAGPREQAYRIHERLAGEPPSAAVLNSMEADVVGGNALNAALTAIDNPDSSGFYNVTLKNWATPWTNRDGDVFAPLNDYTATVIGMVRDGVPFNTIFSADLVYIGQGFSPGYSMTDNNHYAQMEDQGVDLKAVLTGTAQSAITSLPPAGTAGVWTTRAGAEAFFIAGTNRAQFRYTMLNHICHDLEEIKDITRTPDKVRQDVSRSPGGDSRIFLNNCIGCHSGQDPMAQAFAFYNFDENTGSIVYTPGVVQAKYFNNDDVFPAGFVTPDDSWANYWREGQNELLGWDAGLAGSGVGAASMGQEMANSDAFAECQVQKAFKAVCLRDPVDTADRSEIARITGVLRGNNYDMKRAFAETAVFCMGD